MRQRALQRNVLSVAASLTWKKAMSEFLSVNQAARAYSIHPGVLLRLLVIGRLDGRKNNEGHWRIPRKALEQYAQKRAERRLRVGEATRRPGSHEREFAPASL